MKKLSLYLFLVLLFCGNVIANSENRNIKLNQLFEELKKSNNNLLSDVTMNNQVVLSKLSNLSVIARIIWGQFFFPFYLMKEKADILFCPGNLGPIYSPVKTVIWIGTIGPFFKNFYTNFLWTDRLKLYINKFLMVASSRTADAVIFESQFTKELFARKYHIKEINSHVINIGFNDYFANNNKNQKDFQEYKRRKDLYFKVNVFLYKESQVLYFKINDFLYKKSVHNLDKNYIVPFF